MKILTNPFQLQIRFLFVGFLSLASCISGNCRTVSDKNKTEQQKQTDATIPASTNSKTRVFVYKYDGSLQCGMGQTIALEIMRKDLKTIPVYRSENKNDNLMHIQACGTPTGRANVFEIDRDQLEAAKKFGFLEWTFD